MHVDSIATWHCMQLKSVYSLGRRQQAFKTGPYGRDAAKNGSKWVTSTLLDDEVTATSSPLGTLRAGSVSAHGGIGTQQPSWK